MKGPGFAALMLTSALVSAPALAQSTTATPSAAAGGATAQSGQVIADATQGEDIVVTGIRSSMEQARDIKRRSTQIVDSIVADDIGKLPDRNVAESLARVSGVQVDRGIGEGTAISIRGLRQNVILFNGRQIVDASGRGGSGIDSLSTSTYGLLALVPSELIGRLDVTKLPSADQIAGALGGIVDIRTRMPLDGPNQIAFKAGGAYESLPKKGGLEVFGLVSHKFADDTLGVLLSASFDRRNLAQQGLDTFSGYSRFTDSTGTQRYGNADARPEDIQERRDTLGIDGAIQWKPRPGVEITLDSFYSKLDSNRSRFWLSFSPTAGLSNAVYSDNNVLLSGTTTGPVLSNSEYQAASSDIWSSALRGKVDLTDRLHTSFETSYDRSSARQHQIYFRLQPNASVRSSVDFDLTKGDLGSYQVNGVDLSDPSQLRFSILFDNGSESISKEFAARSDWTYDLDAGLLNAFDFGARFSELRTTTDPRRADIRPAGGIPATQLGDYLSVYSNPDFATGDFAGIPRSYLGAASSITSCAVFTDIPAISQDPQCLDPANTVNALSTRFEIKEALYEAYGKLDFQTGIGATSLSGNIGVRYLRRDLASTGNVISPVGAATPTTFRRTDNEWLPTGILRWNITDELIARVGAAKVLTFPNTGDLNNGVSLSNNALFVDGVQTVLGTGGGGAPNLDPFKANQIDFSAEYYFGRQAMVSVGLFYKDISTFIVQQQSQERYSGIDYLINRKINGEGATVKGVEGVVQLPFYFLPQPFDGFGVMATYSYISSETPIRDVGNRALPFPGLSKNNVNLIGFYEKGPFSVRGAFNWRDAYLVTLSSTGNGIYNDSYTDLSATMRYDVTKNVSVGLEANNLLNAKQRTYDGFQEALRTNVFFGRIFKASVSAKF